MNAAHFHLVVNHFPIILPIIALLLLLAGIVWKAPLLQRFAYALFAMGAITAFIAMNSGEGAEEIAEKLPGITKQFIHEHEERAETFALLSYLLGALALVAMWLNYQKRAIAKWLNLGVIVVAIITLFFAQAAGNSGGEIRHTEIRKNTTTATDGGEQVQDDD